VAQMLDPLHRERWRQQQHQVSLLPLLPGPSPAHMARVTRKVLDQQVGPAGRSSSPATSRALWAARVLAWT
jgi:hypothetical protein